MKIMIGTMHCGEGDFDKCKSSVSSQTMKCDHVVFSNLPEVESHLILYKHFCNNGYNYLLKLDADMVLKHRKVIECLLNIMQKQRLDRFTCRVDDYFTSQPIQGMHMFSSRVKWNWDKFVKGFNRPDRLDSFHLNELKSSHLRKVKVKRSFAWHCYSANDKQSFHYGFHRWLKGDQKHCSLLTEHFLRNDTDRKLKWAMLGMQVATEMSDSHVYDYSEQFDELFLSQKLSSLKNHDDLLESLS